MSLRSFDESLLANLSSRHLFRGMLHGYEFILSRVISRTILSRAPCTHDDYLLNTSHLLDCSYLLSANPFAKKIAFEERLKSYGLRFTFVSFQVLTPPSPIGGRKERGGGGKGKKREILRGRLLENGGQTTVRQTALSDFKESLKQYISSSNNLCHLSEKS